MKQLFKVMFVAILAIAVAAPAMADVKLNGYFRTQMQADTVDGNGAKDAPTEAAVDQRIRMKVTNQLNDEVKVVYYGEVDTVWGSQSKGSIGGGGQVGADGVNIETKNAYVAFNVPNTVLSASVGLQGFGLGYEGVVIAQDAAGVKANMALSDAFDLGLQYAKFNEGSFSSSDDDDYYAAQAKFKLAGGNKLAAHLMFMNLNGSDEEVTGAGVRYDGKFGDVGFNAWGVFHDVEPEVGNSTTGFGASTQAIFGKAAVRFTYFTGDDGSTGDSDEFVYDIGNGGFGFYKENLQIMFYDIYYNNLGSTGKALERSEGLMAINGKYDMMMGDMYLKLGAGYFMTAEDVNVGGGATDDVLGAEVSARLGKKIAEKVDVSLNCAYAMVGDAFAGTTNTDDIWKANFMVNVPF